MIDEPWSDDERLLRERIERELQQALDVAPSPGFAAGVRERVARAPRAAWPFRLAAAAAAGLLLWLWPAGKPRVRPESPRQMVAAPTPSPSPSAALRAADAVRVPRPLIVPAARPAENVVLIPAGEREALQRYMEAMTRGQAGPGLPRLAGGLESTRPSPDVPPMEQIAPLGIPAMPSADLEIAPIRIGATGV